MLYRGWAEHLPSTVRVRPLELPGHGARRALPPLADWPVLIDALVDQTLAMPDANVDFAVFGHSLGALVGIELLRGIERRTGRKPVWFGASACVAPGRRAHEAHWLDCTHDAMVEQLQKLGGTPEELTNDREFIDFMLPVLRADFHLCGTYPRFAAARPAHARVPLDCPIAVFTGRDDSATANAEDVAAWSAETRGPCTQHRFDGGHFYIDEQRGAVLDVLAASVARAKRGACANPIERELWTH